MGNYFMKGYHIIADNVFTNIALARFLFKKHIFLTGTIRRNRKYIPLHLKRKLHVGKYKYSRNREILLLAYKENTSQKQNCITFINTWNKTISSK